MVRRTGTRVWIGLVVFLIAAVTIGAQSGSNRPKQEPPDPTLSQRPVPNPQSLLISEGKIKLDVVVEDAAGKPVSGLEPWDFKILDNGQARKVVSFRRFDGVQVKPEPPVVVDLVLDLLNLPFQQVAFVRSEVGEFLRQNGGQLKQPITLMVLTDKGLQILPHPSSDGNAIAGVVDQMKGHVSSINAAMGGDGWVERFQRSTRAIDDIAQNEQKKPGRKLLIWLGPGWPMLNRPSDDYTEKQQRRNFDFIVEVSTALRQAQLAVYSVAPAGASGVNPILYQKFLSPVKRYQDAESGNLGLKVLAAQTGGKNMGPDNDLVSQMNRCIEDANAYYQISFNPPAAENSSEYHDLKVEVDRPGLIVRTTTGYYNQPASR